MRHLEVDRKPGQEERAAGRGAASAKRTKRPHRGQKAVALRIAAKKVVFLDALRDKQDVRQACLAAGISHQQPYVWREKDKAFADGWVFALRVYVDDLRASASKRARDGTKRPIFHKDKIVGVVTEFETALTIFLLKKLEPEVFGDRANQIQGMSPEEYGARAREAVAAMEESTVQRSAPAEPTALSPASSEIAKEDTTQAAESQPAAPA